MTKLFPRARLSRYVGALVMVLMLLKPSPAHAWFGWLDEWSGPGGWSRESLYRRATGLLRRLQRL